MRLDKSFIYACPMCKPRLENGGHQQNEEESDSSKIDFYTHKMGGIKPKIYEINHQLSKEIFKVIFIQETWFNSTVSSEELTSNTNYQIIRHDRSNFNTNKINGGEYSLLMLVHNS